ncbi:MAG TPA: cupin domain-containing protein [Solirubrobacteraceae bacterium]|nr:cupin domain-containing protein [Solirubrobacteraceae bacterium]
MPDVTTKPFNEMESTFLGAMRRVRAELGLSSFGVQTVDLPPDFDRYPWHDHAEEGQEELFVALRGGGWLEIESGERYELKPDLPVRVGPAERRRVVSGPEGIRMLIVGGTPDRAYSPKEFSQLGAPDPMAATA